MSACTVIQYSTLGVLLFACCLAEPTERDTVSHDLQADIAWLQKTRRWANRVLVSDKRQVSSSFLCMQRAAPDTRDQVHRSKDKHVPQVTAPEQQLGTTVGVVVNLTYTAAQDAT